MNDDERKRWSWSPLVGIKYDDMPVGLIAVLAVFAVLISVLGGYGYLPLGASPQTPGRGLRAIRRIERAAATAQRCQ